MTTKKAKIITYKNSKDFAKAMGLSEVEIDLVREKKKLIEKLKTKRKKENLTQADVAKLVGSKQPAIARMESGQVSEVSMDFLTKVALSLDMSFTIRPKKAA